MAADLQRRTFDFLAILTIAILFLYSGAHIWALAVGIIEFSDFATNVGPLSGMLLGYWVRDQKAAS